jgi:hypothetical protein
MGKKCRVIRQSDQMCCSTCGRSWDVGDEDVPECPDRPMDLTKRWAADSPYKFDAGEKVPVVDPEEARKAAMREIENSLKKGE